MKINYNIFKTVNNESESAMMEKQTITIYDVAREAGVSMATVSRVVNGNPNVKPSTRKKVSEVIERLNYRPNAVARGLASKKTTTVGVIIPNITDQFFALLANGIDDIALMYKYNIILANSDDVVDKEIKVFNTLLAQQVDGIIIMGSDIEPEFLKEIEKTSTPVVFAGAVIEKDDAYVVNIDDREAAKNATKYLLDSCDRVAMVDKSSHQIKHKYRVAGFNDAYREAGKDIDEDLIFMTELSYREADRIVDELIEAKAQGVIVFDDAIAAAVMNEYERRGYEVPKDIQIMSGHNTMITELTRPTLTSIELPLYDIGAVAMRLLTKIMNEEDDIDERQIILPHKIKERESTV